MLTLKRAQEIKSVFLNDIEQSRTIPARLVQPLYEFYNQELRPGKYAQQPCGCNPKEWIRIVEDITQEVNKVLSEAEQSNAIVEEPQPEVKKKKVKGTAAAEDK